jgi:hypothetical protein
MKNLPHERRMYHFMKALAIILLVVAPLMATCRPADVISRLRPGAEFYMPNSNDPSSVQWLSGSVRRITNAEFKAAMSACLDDDETRAREKAQARSDIKSARTTDSTKIKALTVLLNMDR